VPTVNALLLKPIPDDARVMAIEPRDDNAENLKLRDLMVARLAERNGHAVADAPLVLRFSTGIVSGRDTPRDGPPNRHGHYGGGRAPPNAVPPETPVTYRLSATLEQRNGPIYWKADVTVRVSDLDGEPELPARLAAILIDNIGRTVGTLRPGGASSNPAQ
jgi:hypothetical protein